MNDPHIEGYVPVKALQDAWRTHKITEAHLKLSCEIMLVVGLVVALEFGGIVWLILK